MEKKLQVWRTYEKRKKKSDHDLIKMVVVVTDIRGEFDDNGDSGSDRQLTRICKFREFIGYKGEK